MGLFYGGVTCSGNINAGSSQFNATSIAGTVSGTASNRDGHVDARDIPAMLIAVADLNKFQTVNGLSAAQTVERFHFTYNFRRAAQR